MEHCGPALGLLRAYGIPTVVLKGSAMVVAVAHTAFERQTNPPPVRS